MKRSVPLASEDATAAEAMGALLRRLIGCANGNTAAETERVCLRDDPPADERPISPLKGEHSAPADG
jgi:hypothetical protein